MPGVGDQHTSASNPFEEIKPHISEYTASEIATLSSRLEKQLGPEYISSRQGPGGGQVHYLAADKCINLANDVFGFNGWSSSIQNIQVDFVDELGSGKVSLGLSVTVRVTLRDGTYHEDIGYGHIDNCKGKALAFEKAKKEGTTDALKRALRNFGNLLGNCIYDKDYVARVTKLKAGPIKWDPENLHRHHDYAPVKREATRDNVPERPSIPMTKQDGPSGGSPKLGDDEFGSDDFDAVDFSVPNVDHPDEIFIDPLLSSEYSRTLRDPQMKDLISQTADRSLPGDVKSEYMPSRVPIPQTPRGGQGKPDPGNSSFDLREFKEPSLPLNHPHQNIHAPNGRPPGEIPKFEQKADNNHDSPVSFYTARAAQSVQSGPQSLGQAAPFNPRLESPSIRKTVGVDHTTTKPVNREALGEAAPPQQPLGLTGGGVQRLNVVNPQSDKTRKVGMPMSSASPMQNRGAYKPPQLKRPLDIHALRDVTATSVNTTDVGDLKRPKMVADMQ